MIRVAFKARKFKTVQIRLREGFGPDAARSAILQFKLADAVMLSLRGGDTLNPFKLASPSSADSFLWTGKNILSAVLLDGKEVATP